MDLQQKIEVLEAELASLRAQASNVKRYNGKKKEDLALEEYARYGRQMILKGFGKQAQIKLKSSRLLVIGAGGLGCPALLYLATAGIGHITIVDHDSVEVSNLHRQVLHTSKTVKSPKVASAQRAILERNPFCDVQIINDSFSPCLVSSPLLNFQSFDMVLDCSDNANTRYLINDACVAFEKPLVSGAAIRLEGQLAIWNLPPLQDDSERGPCYRCVFPEQVTTSASQNCEDEGVLGTVTGVIGVLMATEAIKLLIGLHHLQPKLMLYSFSDPNPFRTLKIKGREVTCPACAEGGAALLLQKQVELQSSGKWSHTICGIGENVPLGDNRISVETFAHQKLSQPILDVRSREEYSICSIPGSKNVPIDDLLKDLSVIDHSLPWTVLCRRGNDSVTAVEALTAAGVRARDVQGGLRKYATSIDRSFPIY